MTIVSATQVSSSTVHSIKSAAAPEESSKKIPAIAVHDDKERCLIGKSHAVTLETSSSVAYCELRGFLDFLTENPLCIGIKDEIEEIKSRLSNHIFPGSACTNKHIHRAIDECKAILMDALFSLEHKNLGALLLRTNTSFDLRFIELAIALKRFDEGSLDSELKTLCRRLIEIGLYRKALKFVDDGKIEKADVCGDIAAYLARQGRVKTALSYVKDVSGSNIGVIQSVAIPLLESGHVKKALKLVNQQGSSCKNLGLFFWYLWKNPSEEFYPEILVSILSKHIDGAKEIVTAVGKIIEKKGVEEAIAFLLDNNFPKASYPKAAEKIFAALADEGELGRMQKFTAALKSKKAPFPPSDIVKKHYAKAYTVKGQFSRARRFILCKIKNKAVRGEALYFLTHYLFAKGNTTYPLRIYRKLGSEVIQNESLKNKTDKLAVIALVKKRLYEDAIELINRLPAASEKVSVLFEVFEMFEKSKKAARIPLFLDRISFTPEAGEQREVRKLLKFLIKHDRMDFITPFPKDNMPGHEVSRCSIELAKEGHVKQARKAALLIGNKYTRNVTLSKILAYMLINGGKLKVLIKLIKKDFKATSKNAVLLNILSEVLMEHNLEEKAREIATEFEGEEVKKLVAQFFILHRCVQSVKEGDYAAAAAMLAALDISEEVKGNFLQKHFADLLSPDQGLQAEELFKAFENKFTLDHHIVQSTSAVSSEIVRNNQLGRFIQILSQVSSPVHWNQAIDKLISSLVFRGSVLSETLDAIKDQKQTITDEDQKFYNEQTEIINAEKTSFESNLPVLPPNEWS